MVDDLYASDKYVGVHVVRVDLDAGHAVAAKHNITSVPTFLFFDNGQECSRVQGASPRIVEEFDKLNAKAVSSGTGNVRKAKELLSAAAVTAEYAQFVPKGYHVLNDVIHFGETLALNVLPLVKTDEAEAKYVFKTTAKHTDVLSDADSQALFFVPLNNISKVYSVLIKFSDTTKLEGQQLELDQDELSEETQGPSQIRMWVNKPGIMSFDDAASDTGAAHVDSIDESKVHNGWYESKVRFVRFQTVQNLNIFIDGSDEDKHTLVEKIVIVGVSGDSREQGSVQALEE